MQVHLEPESAANVYLEEQVEVFSNSSEAGGPTSRPWYMTDGTVWPEHCSVNSKTGERDAALFPEEAAGDRMISQLMFLPAEGVPALQDSSDLPLKKILFWTGAAGWGVKPGRGVFLKVVEIEK